MAKKIRIYKILPVADGIENWAEIHRRLLAPLVAPDVEITQVDLPHAPIKAIGGAYDTELVAHLQTQEAIKGAEAGYDAIAMGCLDEPGVSAAKEVLDIPVVGEAEAAMHSASLLGRRFSFVKGDEGGGMLEDLARKYGLAHKLASIRPTTASSLDFAAGQESIPQRMLFEARKAVEDDGADVIIGYGGIDIIEFLRHSLRLPVISPIQTCAMMAISLVRQNLTHSKRAYPTPFHLLFAEETPNGK